MKKIDPNAPPPKPGKEEKKEPKQPKQPKQVGHLRSSTRKILQQAKFTESAKEIKGKNSQPQRKTTYTKAEIRDILGSLKQDNPEDRLKAFEQFFKDDDDVYSVEDLIETAETPENIQNSNASYVMDIKDTLYYNKSCNEIGEISISKKFTTQLTLDIKGNFEDLKLELRKSGSQYRHAIPVGLVKEVFMGAFEVGASLDEIIKSLALKVEIFKPYLNEKDNDLIQAIFDYYKVKENITQTGVQKLIQLIAGLYHSNPYQTFPDKPYKIPKINQCYMLPTLPTLESKLYIHAGEGTFITALLKILRNFNNILKVKGKKLSDREIAQMIYAIYAMLDYLPLSKDPKPLPKSLDPEKHRHPDEPIGRLIQITQQYLVYIFEAFPQLHRLYASKIREKLYEYLAVGVEDKDLLCTFGFDPEDDISVIDELFANNKLEAPGADELEWRFTNAGYNKGFAAQYNMSPEDFKKLMVENDKNPKLSVNFKEYEEGDEDIISESDQSSDTAETCANFETMSLDLLLEEFKKNPQGFFLDEKNGNNDKFCINGKIFNPLFHVIYYQGMKDYYQKDQKHIKNTDIDDMVKKSLSDIFSEDARKVLIKVRELIKKAWQFCRDDNLATDDELSLIKTLHDKLVSSKDEKEKNRKNSTSSIESGDVEYKPGMKIRATPITSSAESSAEESESDEATKSENKCPHGK